MRESDSIIYHEEVAPPPPKLPPPPLQELSLPEEYELSEDPEEVPEKTKEPSVEPEPLFCCLLQMYMR